MIFLLFEPYQRISGKKKVGTEFLTIMITNTAARTYFFPSLLTYISPSTISPGRLALEPFFVVVAVDRRWLSSEAPFPEVVELDPSDFFALLILRTFVPSGRVMISTWSPGCACVLFLTRRTILQNV